MKFIKDLLTPILTALIVLAGLAYATGIRDEKIERLDSSYKELKSDLKDLSIAVRELNKSMNEINRQEIFRDASRQDKR